MKLVLGVKGGHPGPAPPPNPLTPPPPTQGLPTVVLSAIVDYVSGQSRDELTLTVSGLISPKREHVRWVRDRKLRIGDQYG
jgi:hypothetical protein